jgi:hypothetical protein
MVMSNAARKMTAETLLDTALTHVESVSVRRWATTEHNRPIFIQIDERLHVWALFDVDDQSSVHDSLPVPSGTTDGPEPRALCWSRNQHVVRCLGLWQPSGCLR